MLGNFSVGDYFKDKAIEFAWELVTDGYGIAPDRVWITVNPDDDYSRSYWRDQIGVPASRIQDDPGNVWGPVGDVGPFGPNTEIYVDLESDRHEGDPGRGPMSPDENRYLEIWNLVFMEFNQLPGGDFEPLAMQNVDTGSGLERVATVLQGVSSIYETDLFLPIMKRAAEIAGVAYGDDERIDTALRIIADHTRGVTFLVADGVLPGNEGRGYVLRRILRRAVQKAITIGIDGAFLDDLGMVVVQHYSEQYPELERRRSAIVRTLAHEEAMFRRTVDSGLTRLEALIESTPGDGAINGDDAFRLHDTFGFPIDLTIELAKQAGLQVDLDGFREAFREQQARSRANLDRFADASRNRAPLYASVGSGTSTFEGYVSTATETEITHIIDENGFLNSIDTGGTAEIVLVSTPFYPESGGQVGDTGLITSSTGTFAVRDTRRPAPDVIVHIGEVTQGFLERDQAVKAVIATDDRSGSQRNHTATHLLHEALRQTLGPETQQAGSYVGPGRLRFDFTAHESLGPAGIREVARIANGIVLADLPVETSQESYESAVDRGAIALFGEKYGDEVRTVEVPGYSLELCGGTHVGRTGEKMHGQSSAFSERHCINLPNIFWLGKSIRFPQLSDLPVRSHNAHYQ